MKLHALNKNMNDRKAQIRKRFHFDPRTQISKNKMSEIQRAPDIIIRDDNGEYSSVKEQNDFNDSSWLAKLVNGLEQHDEQSKPLSEITNQLPIKKHITNTTDKSSSSNVYTIERKGSQQLNKFTSRKSLPTIQSYINKKRQRENKKMSLNTLTISKQQSQKQNQIIIKETKKTKQNQNKHANRIKRKQMSSKMFPTCSKHIKQKQCQKQNHKNSIINYSSIKQEDLQQWQAKQLEDNGREINHEAIMIDLDQISLKTQISRQNTPAQKQKNKRQFKKSSQKGQQNKSANLDAKHNSLNSKKIHQNKQNKSQNIKKGIQLKIQSKKRNLREDNFIRKQIMSPTFCNYNTNGGIQQNKIQSINSLCEKVEINQKLDNVLNRQQKIDTQKNDIIQNLQKEQLFPNNREVQFASYNEFLDTFKQEIFPVQTESVARVGIIKKNTKNVIAQRQSTKQSSQKFQQKSTQKSEKIQNQELKIPTFSDRLPEQTLIKKQIIINNENSASKTTYKDFSPLKNISNHSIKPSAIQLNKSADKINKKSLQQIKYKHLYSHYNQYEFSQKPNKVKKVKQRTLQQEKAIQLSKKIFEKLNGKRQSLIHKLNCRQSELNEDQKMQFGSLISKIKYMNHSYNLNQFIGQCLKLQFFHVQQRDKQEFFSPLTQKQYGTISLLEKFKSINTIKQQKRYIRQGQNLYRGNSLSDIRVQKSKLKETKILTQKKIENYQDQNQLIKSDCVFQPLFPETISTNSQYGQMLGSSNMGKFSQIEAKIQNKRHQRKEKQNLGSDLGNIIDSLNAKLNNYIQHNNLEDTYRKFKLEFVQLRRNMHY